MPNHLWQKFFGVEPTQYALVGLKSHLAKTLIRELSNPESTTEPKN